MIIRLSRRGRLSGSEGRIAERINLDQPPWSSYSNQAMTIHVNIGEAKTRLSELLNAMKRGERVVIMRAGEPEAEIVPARPAEATTREDRARKRMSAFGMYKDAFKGADLSLEALKADRGDPEERFERKFGASS
jgi:prevent-host-death family protein